MMTEKDASLFSLFSLVSLLMGLIGFIQEREEVSAHRASSGTGEHHVRRLHHGPALSAAHLRLLCGRPLLLARSEPHCSPALPVPRRRERHPQRHVDPALPLQPELPVPRRRRPGRALGQPAQRHPHLPGITIAGIKLASPANTSPPPPTQSWTG